MAAGKKAKDRAVAKRALAARVGPPEYVCSGVSGGVEAAYDSAAELADPAVAVDLWATVSAEGPGETPEEHPKTVKWVWHSR